jgi:nitroimidazol reductase NimA-like FMN-containing flavoprotein (pyridoxamine 5'-phosphate oxidase superfamily)
MRCAATSTKVLQVGDDEMMMEDLSEADCFDLLAGHHFGRIGVVVGGRPTIFPVNYFFEDGRVAIRTDPGTKLSAAAQGQVAFEIDGVDEAARAGWSVVVTGVGYEVTDALDDVSEALRRFPVDTWAPGQKSRWIRIEPQAVTGRRLRPA